MSIILLIIFLQIITSISAQNGIEFFEGKWDELLVKAKQLNKPIFIDGYASWCGPCKWMAKNIFVNDEVGKFYNDKFINYKIDMEKGEGPDIAKKYAVHVYPTYLFLAHDGKLMHCYCGSMKAEAFIELGKTALDPELSLASIKNKYENNNRSPQLIYDYALALRSAYMDYDKVVKEYFASQQDTALCSEINWKFIKTFTNDMDSREYKHLVENHNKFSENFSQAEVIAKIREVALNSIYQAARKNDKNGLKKISETISNFNINDNGLLLSDCNLLYYKTSRDWNSFCATADTHIIRFEFNDPKKINDIAWTIYERCENKELLEKADSLVVKGINLDNSYYINDTHAALLFKLGKKEESLKAAEAAIEIAKQTNEDYKSTEELIKKIKEMN